MRIKSLIYAPALIIFGIALIVAGILGIHKINKAKRQAKRLANSVNSDPALYTPTTKSSVDKAPKSDNKKVYYIFILFGIACVIMGALFCITILADNGIINISDTLFEHVINWLIAFIGGVFFIALGVSNKKSITNNSSEWDTIPVTGTVIQEVIAPQRIMRGYGRLLVMYKDPYDGTTKYYTLMQQLNLKKHPIGSKYVLSYSKSQRTAYDTKTNNIFKRLKTYCFIIGIILFITGLVSIAMYFGGLKS